MPRSLKVIGMAQLGLLLFKYAQSLLDVTICLETEDCHIVNDKLSVVFSHVSLTFQDTGSLNNMI